MAGRLRCVLFVAVLTRGAAPVPGAVPILFAPSSALASALAASAAATAALYHLVQASDATAKVMAESAAADMIKQGAGSIAAQVAADAAYMRASLNPLWPMLDTLKRQALEKVWSPSEEWILEKVTTGIKELAARYGEMSTREREQMQDVGLPEGTEEELKRRVDEIEGILEGKSFM